MKVNALNLYITNLKYSRWLIRPSVYSLKCTYDWGRETECVGVIKYYKLFYLKDWCCSTRVNFGKWPVHSAGFKYRENKSLIYTVVCFCLLVGLSLTKYWRQLGIASRRFWLEVVCYLQRHLFYPGGCFLLHRCSKNAPMKNISPKALFPAPN